MKARMTPLPKNVFVLYRAVEAYINQNTSREKPGLCFFVLFFPGCMIS